MQRGAGIGSTLNNNMEEEVINQETNRESLDILNNLNLDRSIDSITINIIEEPSSMEIFRTMEQFLLNEIQKYEMVIEMDPENPMRGVWEKKIESLKEGLYLNKEMESPFDIEENTGC